MSSDWLVAICLFWFASAVYFGGFERDVRGASGFRTFLGLVLSYAVFLVVRAVVGRPLHSYSEIAGEHGRARRLQLDVRARLGDLSEPRCEVARGGWAGVADLVKLPGQLDRGRRRHRYDAGHGGAMVDLGRVADRRVAADGPQLEGAAER